MTIAQQWKEEGRQEGRREGEARLLQFQLQKRFGSLSSQYVQRMGEADAETLLHWGEKLLDAKTLEDVFDEK